MRKDNVKGGAPTRIARSLQALAVGSYVFQCGVAAELGLHSTDLQALHALGAGSFTAGALAERLGLTSGATTALIDRLAVLGYVERDRDASDRRRVTVRLRREGASDIRGKYRAIDRRVRRAMERRTADELRVIADFLTEIAASDPSASDLRRAQRGSAVRRPS